MDDYNIADLRRLVFPEDRPKIRKLLSFAGLERPKVSSDRSTRTALVYAGELSDGVPADGYFDFIVPAEKLLQG